MPSVSDLLNAAVLGVVEGLTEFLPVSSTGHLILFGELLGFQGPPGHVFEVAIQLGAILAVVWAFFGKLWGLAVGLPLQDARGQQARKMVLIILVAFLPALVIGGLAHSFIKQVLFNHYVVCASLILGGVVLLFIDRWAKTPKIQNMEAIKPRTGLIIGLFQCVSMIPGVSRSGTTIVGGMLCGVDKKAAAEFSFFLSLPTMFGATAYDLYKGWNGISMDGAMTIGVGFIVAFISALIVIRPFLDFVGRHGLAAFGWYRIAAGMAMLALLFTR
ncbi:MAG: undecaprenyl-diphosphate phosphatase [Alphaproteobacteria bacterium]|nr:MAG: undecaprenyl-diphosphate phosphatase [Alphaproteobacteria bacterium]